MTVFSFLGRPAKYILRHMLVDSFGRLKHIAELTDYGYVGFGGLEFIDFELMRRTLNIPEMVSIEKNTADHARYLFNRPFAGIKVLGGKAFEHLPFMDWSGLRIVWLDYEQPLDEEVLGDATLLAQNLIPGSVFVITLNAMPSKPRETRRATLADRVGEERIPAGVDDDSLALWGLAETQRRILQDAIKAAFRDRNDGATFQQLYNFFYQDDARMQSYGGIVLSPAIQKAYEACAFEDLAYIQTGAQVMIISPPFLTTKEVIHLNQQLPSPAGETPEAEWLSDASKKNYEAVYRWYPTAI